MILKLENTVTHQIYEYDVEDMNNGKKLFFRFNINTTDLIDGEYNLTLYNGDDVVCTDLLKIGDFNPNTLQYKSGNNTYIAVELNGNYEDGFNAGIAQGIADQKAKLTSIEITSNGEYKNDDGYSTVTVNVADLNGSYDDGYAVGKEDGIADQKAKLGSIEITENGEYKNDDGYSTVTVNVTDLNGSYDDGYAVGKEDGIADQKAKLGSIEITSNGTYENEDGYNKVVVNLETTSIPTKVMVKDGLKFGYSAYKTIPDFYDFDGVTDMSRLFYNCSSLTSIPELDTRNVTNMNNMFYCCFNLTSIPELDTSNVTNMESMFNYCSSLTTIPLFNTSKVTTMKSMFYNGALTTFPELDTSNVTNMESMFHNCGSLKSIPPINTSSVTIIDSMFYSCTSLVSVPPLNAEKVTSKQMFGYSDMTALTDFGGLIGLKVNFNGFYAFNKCPNLTYQSCINILNGLYDFRSNGDTTTTRTLKVHQNFLNAVGDEVSIGTNKGWVITT